MGRENFLLELTTTKGEIVYVNPSEIVTLETSSYIVKGDALQLSCSLLELSTGTKLSVREIPAIIFQRAGKTGILVKI